jgi:cell division septation protein DedD
MNRIITILVTIFILLLGYIWISHVWGTEKPRQPKDIVEADGLDAGSDILTDVDTGYSPPMTDPMAEDAQDEFQTERSTGEPTEGAEPEPAKEEPAKPVVAEQKPAETKPAPEKPVEKKPEPKAEPKSSTVTSSSTVAAGKHMVIVGNFSQLANAEQLVKDLKKAGYPNAEIVRFDMSQYHTVCAGRYDDVNEARKVAKKLKDYEKIDAYVRIGG